MARREKPVIHGKDHRPNGPDPIGIGVAIDFNKNNILDVDGNNADYLQIKTIGTTAIAANFADALTDAAVTITNADDNGGIELVNDSTDGIGILQTGDGTVTDPYNTGKKIGILVHNDGNGDLVIDNLGTGRLIIHSAGAGVTIDISGGSADLEFLNLPTTNPGGTGRVWNNSGVLNIT